MFRGSLPSIDGYNKTVRNMQNQCPGLEGLSLYHNPYTVQYHDQLYELLEL